MGEQRERRLAAILAADVVGYSRLVGEDEEATLAELSGQRIIVDGLIGQHRGRVFGSAGDSVIAEFQSPGEAGRAAVDIQLALFEQRLADRRIGLDLSDDARRWLAHEGYDPAFGARPLKRIVQRELADKLAVKLLDGTFAEDSTIRVAVADDRQSLTLD